MSITNELDQHEGNLSIEAIGHPPGLIAPGENNYNVLALRIMPEEYEAQEATLKAAGGIPFCEVCSQNLAHAPAQPLSPSLPPQVYAAQTAFLQEAAEQGIPYCEACAEKPQLEPTHNV